MITCVSSRLPAYRRLSPVPIGFVSDHIEVVFDLDTEAAATAAEMRTGIRSRSQRWRPSCVRQRTG